MPKHVKTALLLGLASSALTLGLAGPALAIAPGTGTAAPINLTINAFVPSEYRVTLPTEAKFTAADLQNGSASLGELKAEGNIQVDESVDLTLLAFGPLTNVKGDRLPFSIMLGDTAIDSAGKTITLSSDELWLSYLANPANADAEKVAAANLSPKALSYPLTLVVSKEALDKAQGGTYSVILEFKSKLKGTAQPGNEAAYEEKNYRLTVTLDLAEKPSTPAASTSTKASATKANNLPKTEDIVLPIAALTSIGAAVLLVSRGLAKKSK